MITEIAVWEYERTCSICFINTISIFSSIELDVIDIRKILIEEKWINLENETDRYYQIIRCPFCRNEEIVKI